MIAVKAILTVQSPGGARSFDVLKVSNYFIDSAIDTDTDSWNLAIGDPNSQLIEVLGRDSEVRCNLYGIGNKNVVSLNTGFVDEAFMTEQGLLEMSGRDITSVATDSQHPPGKFKDIRPHVFVAGEARELQIGGNLQLAQVDPFKTYYTDGSESFWEVWYRLYRKRKKYMWAEADGTLFAGELNYAQAPVYKFGRGEGGNWIAVESLEWRANKQQRIWECFVFGHNPNKTGFVGKSTDPKISNWIRRRTLILTDPDVDNQKEAEDAAAEEIFESTVGAVEIKLVVKSPGFIVRQNRMAQVNIPEVGLGGDYFVVGSRIVGDVSGGLLQEVRLREKQFALTKRVPDDPDMEPGIAPVDATNLATILGVKWSDYFVGAANKFHGPWPLKLFLGVLLAICEQETGFANVRRGSHTSYPANPPSRVSSGFSDFASNFANERKHGRVSEDYAVGPMQLLTAGYKYAADLQGGTAVDELYGARWNPKWNIYVAAAVLNSKLQGGWSISPSGVISKSAVSGLSLHPTEDNIWGGVADYGEGSAYANQVKKRYENTYKGLVNDSLDSAQKQSDQAGKAEDVFYCPLRVPWNDLGGVSAHMSRQLGNWQSDNAVDMGKPAGSPVFACVDGIISPGSYGYGESHFSNPKAKGWRLHLVSKLTGNVFFYQHLAPNLVGKKNQHVSAGQLIGYIGNFREFPNHVHFAAMHGDPEKMAKDGKKP